MNLLWSIVHVPSIENTLSLSSHRRLCFLFWLSVTDPSSTTSFRILKFQFLIIWSLWSFAPVFNCWWFRSPLFSCNVLIKQGHHNLKLNWSLLFWLVQSLQDRQWRHYAYSQKVHDPIVHRTSKSRTASSFLQTCSEQFCESLYCFKGSRFTEKLKNHVRN